ncbi:astacin-like metalloprotease toxin 5 [Hyalella azteca]|uniref:Metalloendopeptidase n=1 Tax=Hyalella azteca TaxID=294128 RepID=A0A8B7PPL3_HYAAZ|nr:astacin-like metalloprotease toxin 5 [Hyalella azteca]
MVRRETLHMILTLCLCLVNIDAAPMDVQRRADGSVLLDDMLYSAEQWDSFLDKNLLSMESLWPKKDGVVNIFYKISDPGVNTTALNLAITAWEAKTCIKFSKMTESDERAEYMDFLLDKSCHAGVGYFEGQPTKVSLANCPERGPTHEIGHALGMKHEQARSDRDDNIIVYMANIKPGMEHNYDKAPTINFEVPYDYYSLMQYRDRVSHTSIILNPKESAGGEAHSN